MNHLRNFLLGFFSVILLVLAVEAYADQLDWSWTAPIARTDGTPFDMATEGAGYNVRFNGVIEMSTADPTQPLQLSPGSNALTKTFSAGTVCAEFRTVDIDGRQSTWSSPVCKDVKAPPGEPTNVTVTIIVP